MMKEIKKKLFHMRLRSALAGYFRGTVSAFDLVNRINWAAAKYMGGWRWLNKASNAELLALKRSVISGINQGLRH